MVLFPPPSDFWNNQKKFVFICQERAFIYFQKRKTAGNFVKTGATLVNRNATEDFTKDRVTATGRKNSLSSLLNCCLPIDNINSYWQEKKQKKCFRCKTNTTT